MTQTPEKIFGSWITRALLDKALNTAIYTEQDEKYLAEKQLKGQTKDGSLAKGWINVVAPGASQTAIYGEDDPALEEVPGEEIPDMTEAERIWKALVDAAQT